VVQVGPLVGVVGFNVLGDGVGVKGGSADLHQHFPCFIVVDNHPAVFAPQGVVGCHTGILVDGQGNVAAHAVKNGVVQAGDNVVPGQLGTHGILDAGGDIPIRVPH